MVDVSGSARAYHDLLAGLWADGETFVLIEHDMIPTREAVTGLEACREWWCANPYPVNHQQGETIVGLGFVRFRAELLAAAADAVIAAGRWRGPYPACHWAAVDARLARVLDRRGYQVHRHPAVVGHLHLV
jgi:hypothetical protein